MGLVQADQVYITAGGQIHDSEHRPDGYRRKPNRKPGRKARYAPPGVGPMKPAFLYLTAPVRGGRKAGRMKAVIKSFKPLRSLRWKMVLRSTAVLVLLVLTIGFAMIYQVSMTEYQNAVESNQILTQTMSDQFNDNSKAFIHQIDFVTLDGEIQDLIEGMENKGDDRALDIIQLRSMITLRSIVMDEISGVYLYDRNGNLLTKWEKRPSREGVYKLPNAMDLNHYLPDGKVSCEFIDGHLVYHRAVRTLEKWETVAYISFLYDEELLQKKLESIAENETRFLGLYDSRSGVLISAAEHDKDAYLRALQGVDPARLGDGVMIFVDGVGEMLLCGNAVMNDGWYFLSAIRRDNIYEMQYLFLLMMAAFALIAVLAVLSVTLLQKKIVMEPIEKIMAGVQKVQNEDYDIALDVKTGDEIELLAQQFNVMAGRINELVNQNLKAELAHRELQLTQLQHQIKPHFLYNTLECINALSQLGRTDEVRVMTGAFARLMKTKMNDRRFTTVREELACVENFLQIYKVMQGDELEYAIHMDAACADCMIPSLIVQPIVENAVLHGIVPSGRKGCCTVQAFLEEECIHISVTDDGVGFPAGELAAVNAYLSGSVPRGKAAFSGIGLRNVLDRIRFVYGASGRVCLLSDREWGTTFDFILPRECP